MWDMCQMLNIWHISHTKPSLTSFIRYYKCYIFLQLAAVQSQICNCTVSCGILGLLIFYFSFTLISLSSSPSAHRLHLHLHSPILFLLPSSLLLYSLPIYEYVPPSISFLPSLIYILHRFFFPFCSLSPLCSIDVGLGCGCDFGLWVWLWVWLWFPIVIGMGIGLWVVGLSFLFYIPVNWPSPFVSSESRLFESIPGARTLWVDFWFRERGPSEICARESRQE